MTNDVKKANCAEGLDGPDSLQIGSIEVWGVFTTPQYVTVGNQNVTNFDYLNNQTLIVSGLQLGIKSSFAVSWV